MLTFQSLVRDVHELVRRTLWKSMTFRANAGPFVTVQNVEGLDRDIPVITLPVGFSLDDDTDAEVITVSASSDANNRLALPTIPRDKAHEWKPGTSGIQSPVDPDRRIEIEGDNIWIKDGKVTVGHGKEVTITASQGNVTISVAGNATISASGTLSVSASGGIAFSGPSLTHNGTNIGSTHVHGGVQPGPGTSGTPV